MAGNGLPPRDEGGHRPDDFFFRGLFSKDSESRRKASDYGRSVVRLIHAFIESVKPRFGWGDPEYTFPKDRNGEPIPPSRDMILGLSPRRNKPWLAFIGPELLQDMGRGKVNGLKARERQEAAGGVLIVRRENPFDYLS